MSDVSLGWSLVEIAEATGGTLVGSSENAVSTVNTDSRAVREGDLFVALVGESFDGHEYAEEALASGAVGVVVERNSGVELVPRIDVESTGDALLALGVKRRRELTLPVIAITGSTGKTSTKDLISVGLEGSWASPRSYNNEIGVPLTVLSTPDDATYLVLEVGSRGVGHIEWLGDVLRPDVAVITNLGVVHLETFGSVEGLADAKYELVGTLGGGGIAVLPHGEPSLLREGVHQTVTFGVVGSDVSISAIRSNELGRSSFTLTAEGCDYSVSLLMAGIHQAFNAAAAVGVALALGLDISSFVSRIEGALGSAWRMEVHKGSYTVVNDAYNANPRSVESALRTVAQMEGRSIAVLGAMAELGSVCENEHVLIGNLADELGISKLIVVGVDHGYAVGFQGDVHKVTDIDSAKDTLRNIIEDGDVVLVKASRSVGLERLALDLIEEALT